LGNLKATNLKKENNETLTLGCARISWRTQGLRRKSKGNKKGGGKSIG
jgi:hypothetical protein